jgi:hypothetical protein
MADVDSWIASWKKLRSEFESQSFAHLNVHLCRWRERKFSVTQPAMRICNLLHLSDDWIAAIGKGKRIKTRIPRQFVMGIGGMQSVGPWTWWLMHERLAKAAQRSRAPDSAVDAELQRAGEVQNTFENLAEHASDLLRSVPDRAGIRLADNAATATGVYLWIMVLFDIAGPPNADRTRITGWFPSFVPSNCLGAETLEAEPELEVLKRNPFCESVAAIDLLKDRIDEPTSRFVPNRFQSDILKALKYRALTKADLAAEVCGGEGTRLYRPGGIKELRAEGLVDHKPRLGYFRPDAPPT